jgi:hypothetical protein
MGWYDDGECDEFCPQRDGDCRFIFDPAAVGILSRQNYGGSGALVAPRCVLTAAHVMVNPRSGVVKFPAVAMQSTRLGQDVTTDPAAPRLGISRYLLVGDSLPDQKGAPDLALAWLDRRAPAPPDVRPLIPSDHPIDAIDYDGLQYGRDGTRLWSPAYGRDCNDHRFRFGTQSSEVVTAYSVEETTPDLVVPQVFAPHVPSVVLLDGDRMICHGDSGGPLIDPELGIKAVLSAVNTLLEEASYATEVAAFEPWLTDQLPRFCAPHFAVEVVSSGPAIDVVGVAEAALTRGEIIRCRGAATDGCAFGFGDPRRNAEDQLIGTGTVVLEAHDVDDLDQPACFAGWEAGPPGSSCPCLEREPEPAGLTASRTCTIALLDASRPDTNELQQASDAEWPGQTFAGNRCVATYVPRGPTDDCPLP